MIRALLLILIFMLLATPAHAVSSVAHAEYTLLDSPASQLDRCYRRCEKNNPPAPSPQPTHSPKPLLCEPIGGVRTFVEGENRMFCFDVGVGGSYFVEVASTTPANVGCSYFQSQLTAPDGSKSNTDGAYPMGVARRMPGRYYFWVQPIKVGAGLCNTYSFTVSK